jgi:hypothetical protein
MSSKASKVVVVDPQALMAYGLCISQARVFCDAIETCDEVKMHRAIAAFDQCCSSLYQRLTPTKRLRRTIEGLQASMKEVCSKYAYGMATTHPLRLNEEEQESKEYRKFRRDLERASIAPRFGASHAVAAVELSPAVS